MFHLSIYLIQKLYYKTFLLNFHTIIVIINNKSEPDNQSSDLKNPTEHYNINGKIFAIADSMNIKVQTSSEDVKP